MKKGLPLLAFLVMLGWSAFAQCPPSPGLMAPYVEHFDSLSTSGSTGTWANCFTSTAATSSASLKWNIHTNGTSSSSTGPLGAHSGSNYIYLETSVPSSAYGDSAIVETPFINTSSLSIPELSLMVHMHGASMGTLKVHAFDGTSWSYNVISVSGQQQTNQGDPYTKLIGSLAGFTDSVKLKIVGVCGTSYWSDMAIDNIDIHEAPACPQPTGLTSTNETSSGATLKWYNVSAASTYTVYYGPTGFSPVSSGTAVTSIANDSVVLTGLSAASYYDYYVISDCSTNGVSDTSGPVTFITTCAAVSSPYAEGFELVPSGNTTNPSPPLCWNFYEGPTGNGYGYTYNYSGYAHTGNQSFRFYNSNVQNAGALTDTLALISPEFVGIDSLTKQVVFWALGSQGAEYYLASTNDPNDLSGMSIIDTFHLSQNYTHEEIIYPLDSNSNYNGTDKYLVWVHGNKATYQSIYIDDIEFMDIPPCPKPLFVEFGIPGANFVPISWTSPGADFDLEYGATGFTPGAGTVVSVSGTSTIISNLLGQTTYDFYVTRDCSGAGNGYSTQVGPYTVTTAYSIPYLDDFVGGYTTDWVEGASSAGIAEPTVFTSQYSSWAVDGFANNGTTGAWRISAYNTSTYYNEWFISAPIDLDTNMGYQLKFDFAVTTQGSNLAQSMNSGDSLMVVISEGDGDFNRSDVVAVVQDLTGSTSGGAKVYVDLSAYNGPIQVGFYFKKNVSGTNSYDLFIDNVEIDLPPACPDPLNVMAMAASDTSFYVTWMDSSAVDSYEIEYGLTGYAQGTGTVVAVNGDSTYVSGLPALTCYDVYVRSICAGGNGLWLGPYKVCTDCPASLTAPVVENFDGPLWEVPTSSWDYTHKFNSCWSPSPAFANTYSWLPRSGRPSGYYSTGPEYDHTTGTTGNYVYIESSYGSTGDTAFLYSPTIDLSALTRPTLNFYYHMRGTGINNLNVDINDGSGWTNIWTLSGAQQSLSTDPFELAEALLASYVGQTVQFRFWASRASNYGYNGDVAIDDFSVIDGPACGPLSSINGSNIGSSTATISWESFGSKFNVEYGPTGFLQGSGVGIVDSNVTNPHTLTGLTPNTFYDVYVNDSCNNVWFGPYSFKTNCVSALNGNYTVGGAAGPNNFATLDSAMGVLNGCGISGPVKFSITGTHITPINLMEIQGSSTANTVTFEGATGADTLKNGSGGSVISMNGTKNVIFDNLIIDGSTGGYTVFMTNFCSNIEFESSTILSVPNNSSSVNNAMVASGSSTSAFTYGNNVENLSVNNCFISGGYYGMRINGISSSVHTNNYSVTNTDFEGSYYAAYFIYDDSVTFNNNNIENARYGLYLYYSDHYSAHQNNIDAQTTGAYLYYSNRFVTPSSNSEFVNNMVNAAGSYGVYAYGANYVNIYHNTIQANSYGFYFGTTMTDMDIRNNIITSLSNYTMYFSGSSFTNFQYDYNVYNTGGANLAYRGSAIADLAAWQAADTVNNINSLEGDPLFIGGGDLHVVGGLANDAGDNSLGILVDIDGDVRPSVNSTTVDIGADEYDVLNDDASVVALLSPTNNTCGDSAIVVEVLVQNFGLDTITSMDVSVDVNGSTLTATYSGALPFTETDTLMVGTFTQIAGANVNIKAYSELVGDQKTSNDTLTLDIDISDASEPVVMALNDTVCYGDSTGIYFQSPADGNFMFTTLSGDTAFAMEAGDTMWTNPIMQDTTFVIDPINSTFNVGGADLTVGTNGGNYTFVSGAGLWFTVNKSIVIDSVTVYPSAAGTLVFDITDGNGVALHTVNRPTTVSGNNPEQIYVGITLPPGNYRMIGNSASTVGLYRNYGVTGFPFNSPNGEVSITQATNGTSYYYFFYNWVVSSASCPRPTTTLDIKVNTQVASAMNNATAAAPGSLDVNLDATGSYGQQFIWKLDGTTVSGATGTYTFASGGSKDIWLIAIDTVCGSIDSSLVTIANLDVNESVMNRSLSVFPNPTKGNVNVTFDVVGVQDVQVRILNLLGQAIYTAEYNGVSAKFDENYNLGEQPAGVYLLEVTTNEGVFTRKINVGK